MDQDRNHGNRWSVFKRIKCFFIPQIRQDARLLDFMQEHPEITPDLKPHEAPPEEFQKILSEMERRGIKPAVRRQLAVKKSISQAGRSMRKPAFVAIMAVLILGGTSVGVSAKKAYDYRMRERETGKSSIIWNNDQVVLTQTEGIKKAYEEIEDKLGIQSLKIAAVPIDMKYDCLEISDGVATIKFIFKDKLFYFIQAKNNVASSNNMVSDRVFCSTVYNIWLDEKIKIEENKLPDNQTEYSTYLNINGACYYLSGIMEEDEFREIISELKF